MKKTDTFTKILAGVLFGALAIYMAVWLWNSTHENLVTAPVTAVSVSDSAQAAGITVREEQLLTSSKKFVSVQAEDGKEVSAGAPLALAVDSETALDRLNHIAELKLEISSLETVLSGTSSAADLTNQDERIRASVQSLSAAVARGEDAEAEGAAMDLSAYIFKQDTSAASQTQLAALKEELKGYSGTSTAASTITAPVAGVFSRSADGFEAVTPADLENLTPAKLTTLINSQQPVPSGVYGKLVGSYKWYFAASIDETHAKRLTVGKTAYLDFARYYKEKIPAVVVSISAPDNGQCAVVFSTKRALMDTLSMRKATADIVFSESEGLRIPLKSAHVDDKGATYVYCVTAGQVEKKTVEIISTQEDYYLVAVGDDADALREGNTVIVSGKDIYEGKVIEQ